jgi:hypothetical protein
MRFVDVVVTFEHLVSLPLIHVEHASHSSSLKNIYYNDAKFERSATLHPTAADRLASTHTESNFSSALFSSPAKNGPHHRQKKKRDINLRQLAG